MSIPCPFVSLFSEVISIFFLLGFSRLNMENHTLNTQYDTVYPELQSIKVENDYETEEHVCTNSCIRERSESKL